MLRIGHGWDLHRLVEGRKLIIAGVEIAHNKGLEGHSDADVVIHALIDALLGAVALGDIGTLFPSSDPQYKDISSSKLLQIVISRVCDENGFKVNNIDVTVIIEKPKLRGYIDQMRQNLAQEFNINLDQISIKAKTSEGIGIVGREEAVIAETVVLLSR